MRHLPLGILFRFLPLIAAGLLASQLGVGQAIAIVLGAGLASVGMGAWLLQRSPVGAIGWRNVLASWLLPWGHVLGGPTLLNIASSSFAAWVLLALAGAFGWSEPWLLAAWVIDGIALAWLTSSAWRQRGDRLQRRVVTRVIAVVSILALAGFVLLWLGHPLLGAVVAGGPIAIVGALYGAYVVLFMVMRPSRYN